MSKFLDSPSVYSIEEEKEGKIIVIHDSSLNKQRDSKDE